MSIKSTMATVLKQLIIRSSSINVLLAIFFYKSHQTSLNFQYTIVAFFFDSTFSRNSLLKIQLKSLLRFSIVGRVVKFGVCLQISNPERQKSGAHHCYHSREGESWRSHLQPAAPIDALNFLKRVDCFPNATIVYRILLTIPVTVATAERSFSKLKLLKSYLRSTMTQERLNGLAMVAIENDLLEKTNIEELIENFVSNNARRILLFK
ncbi:hypothetical protein V2J09_000601 [Rumex salicifolius]